MSDAPGYALHVSERTTAAMQLATYFTEQAMVHSTSVDPRERLAEQLSYFDLAFRSVMGSTARGVIKAGTDGLPNARERVGSGDLR